MAPRTQLASAIDGNNKTVLVIDDDPSVLELLTDIFTEANFSILTAAISMEGIELYRALQDGIAALILDYSMPLMDGKAAFGELMKINANVKVLLCSGYMENDMTSAFGDVQPNEFIHKPYTPASLLDRVWRMLSESTAG
jgi:two-component system cell cycle sensor histidine kinase/response regulator CckA